MHDTAGQLNTSKTTEQADAPKTREAAARPAKRPAAGIHPSLRALPDYPE